MPYSATAFAARASTAWQTAHEAVHKKERRTVSLHRYAYPREFSYGSKPTRDETRTRRCLPNASCDGLEIHDTIATLDLTHRVRSFKPGLDLQRIAEATAGRRGQRARRRPPRGQKPTGPCPAGQPSCWAPQPRRCSCRPGQLCPQVGHPWVVVVAALPGGGWATSA